MQQNPSWEANRLFKNFPAFYGTWSFFAAFTSAATCPCPELDRSSPLPSWRPTLKLSSHLRLGLPSGLFTSDFPTNILYTPLVSPIRVTRPTDLIILDLITRTILGEVDRSLSSSLCSFFHSPVYPALLVPNIFLNTLFSNTLSLHCSLNVSNQFSHPYKTIGKIVVLCILIFKFLVGKLKVKRFCTEW